MALPLAYFFLCLLFFLPNFYFSCPNSLTCGDVKIHSPFFLNASGHPSSTDTTPDTCAGKYSIRCDDDSGPMIKFNDREYPVIDIIYPEKVLILQDLALGNYLRQGKCGFLYKFTDPIPNFHVPPRSPVLIPPNGSVDCQRDTHAFSRAFFPELNGSNHCNDYKLYYWEELEDHHAPASNNCLVTQPTLLEWKLSFGGGDGSLSLLSVGFSRTFELHEYCFYCQTTGQSCTGNNRAANSSCSCENICKHKGSWSKKKIIGIVAGAGGALILGCSVGLFLYMNRRKRRRQSILLSQSITSEISLRSDSELVDTTYHTHIFSYGELEEATDSFNESRKLGDGGFGTVYKGELKDGRTVAVKRLFKKNYRRLEQFMNEIEILSYLRHPNLIALYGCTSRHSRELLLVYEFISNGTLADHLHGPLASKGAISWPIRISIAIQTADALAYLHSVEPQIIHRDVKTSNILLDKNFHVKVADFGLSRLFPLDVAHVSTAPQGTPGYVDPEYHQCYRLTDKSDVYSFGVVLIELISSKPAVDISRNHHEINLANMAITKIQNRQIDQLVDFELGYQSDLAINKMIDQVAEIAFQCLQSERDMRPSIREVFEILKKIEGGEYKADKKNVSSSSLDTVTEKWPSRSTTPNSSS